MQQTRHKLNIGDINIASFSRPCMGERVNGDAVIIERRDQTLLLALVDALGHGPSAHAVAVRAARFLRSSWNSDVHDTIHGLHAVLKGTIGAVAGICVVDTVTRELRYAGVGNTVFRTMGSRATRLFSTEGVIGSRMRQPPVQAVPLNRSDIILLYSDGVSDRFDVEHYPQILYHSARAIARKVVDKFGKSHDDATCIVMRYGR